jgi:hypothetical protein
MTGSTVTRDGIDEVREILVGAIQRDLERKISKLEGNLGARVGELQQELRRRVDVVEAHLRKELDALSARLERDIVELKDSVRGLTRDLRETNSASEQRVGRLEEANAHGQHELRSQILEQAKSFLDELHETREEFAETLERELGAFEPEGAKEATPREPRDASERATP